MKPIWKILIAAVVIVAIVAVILFIPHYRAMAALRKYREQLIAKGEKLTIAELVPSVSREETAAGQELLTAAGMTVTFTNSPPMMKPLAPGRALVGWSEAISPTDKLTNCWPEFSAVVKRHPEITGQIAEALQKPGIGFDVQYQQGYNAQLPFLAPLRRANLWLSGQMMLDLHEGRTNEAWKNLWLQTELLKKYRGEPVMMCQVVRATLLAQTSIAATWEALQRPGWSDKQLEQLQTNWESFEILPQSTSALSMEQPVQALAYEKMRNSYQTYDRVDRNVNNTGYGSFNDVLINPQEGLPVYLSRRPRYWVWQWWRGYDEELYAMQTTQAALEALRKVQNGTGFYPAFDEFRQTVTDLQKLHPGWQQRFAFANRLESTTSSFLRKIGTTEMARRMVVTVLALERFRLRHGEYPARLEELTPDYVMKVPTDFMDAKPLRYRHKDDGTFLLYSVGLDGKDDGGQSTPVESDSSNGKLWSYAQDAVWPAPATAEEVKNYETEMLKKVVPRRPGQLVPPISMPKPSGTNAKAN